MSKTDTIGSTHNMAFIFAKEGNTFENSKEMSAYEKMYYTMFNAVTDAMEKIQDAEVILSKAQQNCEQTFIEAAEAPLALYCEPTK